MTPKGYEHCIRGHLEAICGDGNGDCIECSIIETGQEAAKQLQTAKTELKEAKKALAELVKQVEMSGAVDKVGHPLKNLIALQDAQALIEGNAAR